MTITRKSHYDPNWRTKAKAKAHAKDVELQYVQLVPVDSEPIRIADIIAACSRDLDEEARTLLAMIAGSRNFMLGDAALLLGYVRLQTIAYIVNRQLKEWHVPARMVIITTGNTRRSR